MSEAITACQNVCQDFSWVSPFTASLANIATFLGVIFAAVQFNQWKKQKNAERASDAALSCLSLANEVFVATGRLMSPVEFFDEKTKVAEGLNAKLERAREYSETMEKFRCSFTLIGVLTKDDQISKRCEELMGSFFEVVRDLRGLQGPLESSLQRPLSDCLKVLADLPDSESKTRIENSLNRVFGGDDHGFLAACKSTLDEIEKLLLPTIQLEG